MFQARAAAGVLFLDAADEPRVSMVARRAHAAHDGSAGQPVAHAVTAWCAGTTVDLEDGQAVGSGP